MAQPLSEVVAYLDRYLRIDEVPDDERAVNGLQLDAGGGTVARIAAAVDVCSATIAQAAAAGADLLLVHHGLFWGGLKPLVGSQGRRVRAMLEAGMSLYSAHLPLDLHAEVGNCAVLARDLGITSLEPFGAFAGVQVGQAGAFDGTRAELVARIVERLGVDPHVIAAGPERVSRVGVVTGAGTGALPEALAAGLDALITGEGPHHSALEAEESGVNLILAGHYATETVGVQALAGHLEQRLGIAWLFVDHPTGL